jgi:hypothetical protein
MTKEYLASVETKYGLRHNLTKYILNNGVEIVLNDEELLELFEGSKLWGKIKILESENMKLQHQKEHYRDLILDFKSVLNQMEKVR